MAEPCPNVAAGKCSCSYPGCPRHAKCCECLAYHLAQKELPGCCFPPNVERSYDRSFRCFSKTWQGRA